MLNFQNPSFLRRVLLADAAASGATGLLMAFGASFLEPLLGLPVALLREAGIILLPFAALLIYIATREHLSRRWVWAVVVMNVIWVMDSILLLLSGWVSPTLLGQAFVIGQALVVAVFAELEYFGVRKSAAALA